MDLHKLFNNYILQDLTRYSRYSLHLYYFQQNRPQPDEIHVERQLYQNANIRSATYLLQTGYCAVQQTANGRPDSFPF